MRPTVIVFALLAVLLAGVAAYLVKLYLDQQAQPGVVATEPTAPVGVTKILVAARAINPGEVLSEVDIRWVDWPQALLEERYIQESEFSVPTGDEPSTDTAPIARTGGNNGAQTTGGEAAQPAAQADVTVVGAVARRRILINEPISPDALIRRGDRGVGAAVVTPGMRAISIQISESSAAAGFIMPGDFVDVVLTANIRSAVDANKSGLSRFDFPDGDTIINYTSESVLENVKVLAIDQSMNQNTAEQGPARVGRTATIEVTPNDAGRLLIASQLGQLTLTLRSLVKEPQTAETQAATEDPFYFTSDTSSSRTLAAITNYMSKAGQPVMPKPKVEEPVAPPPPPPVDSTGGTVRVNRGGNVQEQSIGQQ